tara:strand:- start:628 stop:1623 length:996 start_codon:yes stop_codon:yes gene_type:complete
MKVGKINYVMVGGFVLAMLAGLVVSIAVLTGRTGATDSYFTIYRNVTGVKFGTQVLYEGYPIGQVEKVTPMAEDGKMRFRVDFEVRKGWQIPADSVAQIAAPGLLSAITLSIRAGEGQALEAGSQVAGQEAANIFAVMSTVAGELSEIAENSLKPLLASINKTVNTFGDMMEGDAEVLIGELGNLAMDVAERLPKVADNIEDFSENINRSSEQLDALLRPENRAKLEGLIANVETASANFVHLSGELEETRLNLDEFLASANATVSENKDDIGRSVEDLRRVTDSLARHINTINQNMEGAARNMYEFSRQIRQNPGLLLGGTPPVDKAATK